LKIVPCPWKLFATASTSKSLDVLARFPEALTRYAVAHGKRGLYHETISWAYILLIHERMQRAGRPQSWTEFASANPDLMTWSSTILKQYYRNETLFSDLARKTFLFPDKAPALPCPQLPQPLDSQP
jgi:hypothetical protein